MIIELSEDDFNELLKKMPELEKYKQKSFRDFLEMAPMDLIGKSFAEGIFAGVSNGEYYFVEPNTIENVKKSPKYWEAVDNFADPENEWNLPTQQELMFLFTTKDIFNSQCDDLQEWNTNEYWSSSRIDIGDDDQYGWVVNFCTGHVCTYWTDENYYSRGIKKLTF